MKFDPQVFDVMEDSSTTPAKTMSRWDCANLIPDCWNHGEPHEYLPPAKKVVVQASGITTLLTVRELTVTRLPRMLAETAWLPPPR